jgi:hypothetical protein
MIDFNTAMALAEAELAKRAPGIGVPVVIRKENTIEKRLAWVFFYNSEEFVKTSKFSSQLAGNGPIVVMKENGETTSYGSFPSVEEILATLE